MKQFLNYLFCGGVSTFADALVFFLIAWLVFPALSEQDLIVQLFKIDISEQNNHSQNINFIIANAIAFIASNLVAYLLNIVFVFKSKRGKKLEELGKFYSLSTVVAFISIAAGTFLMKFFLLSASFAYAVKVFLSVTVNFIARKRLVFNH